MRLHYRVLLEKKMKKDRDKPVTYCTQMPTVHIMCVRLGATRMSAQVPTQSVATTAGVAAHRAFERLLPGVQFDVAKQVSLLGKGGPTLSAVEWPLT